MPFVLTTVFCISIIFSLGTIIYLVINGKRTLLLFSFIVSQSLAVIWSFGQLLQLCLAPEIGTGYIYYKIYFIGVCFISVSWLVFCLAYTNSKFIQNKRNILLLMIPPVIYYLIMATNEGHHLFYASNSRYGIANGPFFWFHAWTSYFYSTAGILLLLWYSKKEIGSAKRRTIIISLTALCPFLATVFFTFQIIKHPIELTPAGFIFSSIFVTFAVIKYNFLDIVPIAEKKIVKSLKQSVIVLDNDNRIVNYNEAFSEKLFHVTMNKKDNLLFSFILELKKNGETTGATSAVIEAINNQSLAIFTGELVLERPVYRSFLVNIEPVVDRKETLGRIVTFHEITEYKRLLEELAASKERNRIARDIHDILGQTMAVSIAQLEAAVMDCEKKPFHAKERLEETMKNMRQSLQELRKSLIGSKIERLNGNGLNEALRNLFHNYEASGIQIDFSIEGWEIYQNSTCYENYQLPEAIYRVCQEALANSLRHGHAKKAFVYLKFINHWVKLFIFDNGSGCQEKKKGLGLAGMEQRVHNLQGNILYGSDGENGFNIWVEIPLKDELL